MPSANAFASISNGLPLNINTEHEHFQRPQKRPRLSDDDVTAAIQTQCAQSDTALEVDHMILDFTVYEAIKACFASRLAEEHGRSSRSLASSLAMSESFLSIFKARHPAYTPDPELRLRILLLKLVTLFTQRMTSNPTTPPQTALQALRSANQDRASRWIGSADRTPSLSWNTIPYDDLRIPQQKLERNRAHVLRALLIPAEDEDYEDAFYGTPSCVPLLDIIPLFMHVSAASNALNESNLTKRWMELAGDFMLQACLEQYLVFGARGPAVADEAFAWGYEENKLLDVEVEAGTGMVTDKRDEINEMFEDEDYAKEIKCWAETKESYLDNLFPLSPAFENKDTRTRDITTHLERIADTFHIATFETVLLFFLEQLSKSIAEPVLVQLEDGKLDGMTEQETQEFLTESGVSTGSLFEAPRGVAGTAE